MVLGMIPLARELLQGGCEVVMAANSLPAINDVTVWELQTLLEGASAHCPLLKVWLAVVCEKAGEPCRDRVGGVCPWASVAVSQEQLHPCSTAGARTQPNHEFS